MEAACYRFATGWALGLGELALIWSTGIQALIFDAGPRPTGPAHISPSSSGAYSLLPWLWRRFGWWRIPSGLRLGLHLEVGV